jgi:Ribose/xylose/arabinose/galactoside ABC-type transport systems, permease components
MEMEKSYSSIKRFFSALVHKYVIVFVLLAMCIFMSFASQYFLKIDNIINVFRQISVTGILAVGVCLVIITGGIDLSVGSALSLGGVTVALLTQIGVNSWVSVLITMAIGFFVGILTGVIIVKVRITAFIATLGMQYVFKGISYLFTEAIPVSFNVPAAYLGGGRIGDVLPFSIIVMILVIIFGQLFSSKTVVGRNIYAVGSNTTAAKMSGIKTDNVIYTAHAICTCLAFLTGILTAGNLTTADPASGSGNELDAIAASVIGGVSLSGGTGNVWAVLLGAMLLGIIKNGFVLLGVSAYWQIVANGLIILLAVGVDNSGKGKK